MTRKEIINELYNLKYADDVPVRHKPVITAMIDTIMDAPPIAAEPERRGKWVKNDNNTWTCSRCHSWVPDTQHYYAHYCLFCGAKMEG